MPPEVQETASPSGAPEATPQPGAFGRGTGEGTVKTAADKILSRMKGPEPEQRPTGDAEDPGPAKRKAKETPSPEPAQQPSKPEAEESSLLRELDAAEDEPGEGEDGPEAAGDEETTAPTAPGNMDDLAALAGFSADQLMDALTLTVKADGEDEAVGFRDLVSSYQREADYRLKTAETAEQRKLLDKAAAATQAERQHYAHQLAPLVQHLDQIIKADETALTELKETDPYEYNRRRDALEDTKKVLQVAQTEQQRMADLQANQDHAVRLEDVNQNAEALIEAVPEWGTDPDLAKKSITEIKDYAVSEYGVPRDLIDNEYRSWALLMGRDAMRYRKLVKSSEKRTKEMRAKPKYVKGGVATRPETLNVQRIKKARTKLAKSGRVRDFATVLAARLSR